MASVARGGPPPLIKEADGRKTSAAMGTSGAQVGGGVPDECAPSVGCLAQPEDMAKAAVASVILNTVRALPFDPVRAPAMDAAVNARRENWRSIYVK